MQFELLFTMLSLGVTSVVSVNTTILGFHLMDTAALPFGGVFGLFLAAFGMYSTWHIVKSNLVSKEGRTQLTKFMSLRR